MTEARPDLDTPLGWCVDQGVVRLSAPLADFVELVERRHPAEPEQRVTAMRRVALTPERPVWQCAAPAPLGCYRFRVHFPWGTSEVADPWSRAVVRKKVPGHPTWSLPRAPLPRPADRVSLNPHGAVLLETHVRDATRHVSAGALQPGTYAGFVERHAAAVGGAHHAVALGVDAVELLPVTEWPVLEGARRNHWGYMPSFLLAGAQRFVAGWDAAPPGAWVGLDRRGAVTDPADQLRALVAELHRRGVGVVVDLVFNHVSGHDKNPLLQLDPGHWFHRTDHGALRSHSGCGNDLNTAAPEMRALVLASVRRWFAEIGVDGVRLDLAELLDDVTLAAMRRVALDLRPDALLVAEPWSLGGYRPVELARAGWVVWDDRYRDGLKGREPRSPAAVFAPDPGVPHASALDAAYVALCGGHQAVGGRLPEARLGLSYLASHDGYTLADFARIALGDVPAGLASGADVRRLSPRALARLRLANALLCATNGPVMFHLGQSFGRSKVQRSETGERTLAHNSYDRDDGTNHVDWQTRALNAPLVAHTGQWIAARKTTLRPVFAAAPRFTRLRSEPAGAVGYVATPTQALPPDAAVSPSDPAAPAASVRAPATTPVAFVANLSSAAVVVRLPAGPWQPVLTDPSTRVQHKHTGVEVHLPPATAALLSHCVGASDESLWNPARGC